MIVVITSWAPVTCLEDAGDEAPQRAAHEAGADRQRQVDEARQAGEADADRPSANRAPM